MDCREDHHTPSKLLCTDTLSRKGEAQVKKFVKGRRCLHRGEDWVGPVAAPSHPPAEEERVGTSSDRLLLFLFSLPSNPLPLLHSITLNTVEAARGSREEIFGGGRGRVEAVGGSNGGRWARCGR